MNQRDVVLSNELERCNQIVEQKLGIHREDFQFLVKWDIVSANLHGQARTFPEPIMRLNPRLADFAGEKYAATIGHEYAHLLASYISTRYHLLKQFPRQYQNMRGHGAGWKYLMRMLGLDPLRCCTKEEVAMAKQAYGHVTTRASNAKTYQYECDRCHREFNFSQRRQNNILRGVRYWCAKCGSSSKLLFRA